LTVIGVVFSSLGVDADVDEAKKNELKAALLQYDRTLLVAGQ